VVITHTPVAKERIAPRRSTVTVISPTGDFGIPAPLLQLERADGIHSHAPVLAKKRMSIANLRNGGIDR
jgi:hypothetical protein